MELLLWLVSKQNEFRKMTENCAQNEMNIFGRNTFADVGNNKQCEVVVVLRSQMKSENATNTSNELREYMEKHFGPTLMLWKECFSSLGKSSTDRLIRHFSSLDINFIYDFDNKFLI